MSPDLFKLSGGGGLTNSASVEFMTFSHKTSNISLQFTQSTFLSMHARYGNKATNEEVIYVCCFKLFFQLKISTKYRRKSTRTKPVHTYIYMAVYKTRFSLQTG